MPLLLNAFAGMLLVSFSSGQPTAKEYAFFHENVLGTSLELRVRAESEELASRAEAAALKEIDRLSGIFSGYDSRSEFRRWQATPGKPVKLSSELFEVLQLSDEWRSRSRGAFDPRIQTLSAIWARAASLNRLPERSEISRANESLRRAAWVLEPSSKTATKMGEAQLSLNAIAKGYIVERACNQSMDSVHGVSGVLMNLGGDLRVCGDFSAQIGIIDPNLDSESSTPLMSIQVQDRAVATSGRSQRGFRIQGKWYSHILDPRTGYPVEKVAGATVIAKRSSDADALATILNVLPPDEGVALVESFEGIECLIIGIDGKLTKSRGWERFEVATKALLSPKALAGLNFTAQDKAWDADHELAIDFEINNPGGNNRRYRRPYVAIWVEDAKGKPVRTLTLWLSLGGSGPDRWLPDMKKWYKVNQTVKEESKIDLVHSLARATRQPGKYSVVWDGKDDKGNLSPAGDYTINIEAAREHGTYQIIRKPVTLAGKPFVEELKGNVEIKSATLSYRRKAEKK